MIYTLGQRHGFTIHSNDVTRQPHYIVAKDLDTNTLVVDTTPPTSSKDSHFALSNINWIGDENMEGEFQAVTRYRQKPFIVKLTKKENQIIYLSFYPFWLLSVKKVAFFPRLLDMDSTHNYPPEGGISSLSRVSFIFSSVPSIQSTSVGHSTKVVSKVNLSSKALSSFEALA